jgi:hypothetical protein
MNAQLEDLRTAIDSVIAGMTVEDLMGHPDGKWSAAEVLEHLSLTYAGTARAFGKCLEGGRPLATRVSLKQRLGILVVTGLGYLPGGREAPATTRPKGAPAEDVARDIGRKIEEMDKAIAECESRYGKTTRLLDHPVLGPLTAHQWRRFHVVHGKHHVKQIENLRNSNLAKA